MNDNNKLKIVGPEVGGEFNGLRIIDNGEDSYLASGNLIVTERTSATDRPIHCSELNKELKHRNWHKHDLKFLGSDGKIYSCIYLNEGKNVWKKDTTVRESQCVLNVGTTVDLWKPGDPDQEPAIGDAWWVVEEHCAYVYVCDDTSFRPDSVISSVWSNPDQVGFPSTAILCNDEAVIADEQNAGTIASVYDLYKKLFGAMKEKEISLYSIPKRVVNIVNGSEVFDLIKYNSAEYTDTVSLGEVLRLPLAPVEFGRVDLGVQYSKVSDNTPRIYNGDVSFTALTFKENKRIVNNVVGSINDEIKYEFLNGVLKVTPTTRDINECIISYCTITYGRD